LVPLSEFQADSLKFFVQVESASFGAQLTFVMVILTSPVNDDWRRHCQHLHNLRSPEHAIPQRCQRLKAYLSDLRTHTVLLMFVKCEGKLSGYIEAGGRNEAVASRVFAVWRNYFVRLRFDALVAHFACIAEGCAPVFVFGFDSSARTTAATFTESTLYRTTA
jgi:hypothetical protein